MPSTARSICPTLFPTCRWSTCASNPRHSHRVLARRRRHPQRLRGRELHRRAGGGGRAGSGRVSAALLGQVTARPGGARARREQGRLGRAAAGRPRARRIAAARLRQLRGAGGRGGGERTATCGCRAWCAPSTAARRSIPTRVVAQMQSGIIFGASAALYGEITLKGGRVEQTNFGDYRMLRINESPVIEVHLVKNAEPPGGMGEPGTSAVMPAIANAVFAATGKRVRKLPISTALAG